MQAVRDNQLQKEKRLILWGAVAVQGKDIQKQQGRGNGDGIG